MKDDSGDNELLKDLLADAASANFRTELLQQALLTAQRRARRQAVVRTGSSVAIAMTAVVLAVWFWVRPEALRSEGTKPDMVRSEALNPAMVVKTQPGTVALVHSVSSMPMLVRTAAGTEGVELLNDLELLALFGSRPAALVYRENGRAELVVMSQSE